MQLPTAPCPMPGCPELTGGARCARHRSLLGQADRAQRGSSTARGFGRKWQKLREAYLAAHPLCEVCLEVDRVEVATVVDHKTPHEGDPALLFDWDNLQSLSKTCHDRKTATQDSGLRGGRFRGRQRRR